MNIECINCRAILLSFERRVTQNEACKHYICQRCMEAFTKFPSKTGVNRCPCGVKMTRLIPVSADIFIVIAMADIKDITKIVTQRQYYQKPNGRNGGTLSAREQNVLVGEFHRMVETTNKFQKCAFTKPSAQMFAPLGTKPLECLRSTVQTST